jgi:hypothetical protein
MFLAQTTKKDIVEITTTIFPKSLGHRTSLYLKFFMEFFKKILYM